MIAPGSGSQQPAAFYRGIRFAAIDVLLKEIDQRQNSFVSELPRSTD